MSKWRWKNFSEDEVSCSCCGIMGVKPPALDKLQALREAVGVPLTINSAYRCPEHNEAVGGSENSRHKAGDAFDISLKGVNKYKLLERAKKVGFKGFGFYNSFLHVDLGRSRSWGNW